MGSHTPQVSKEDQVSFRQFQGRNEKNWALESGRPLFKTLTMWTHAGRPHSSEQVLDPQHPHSLGQAPPPLSGVRLHFRQLPRAPYALRDK